MSPTKLNFADIHVETPTIEAVMAEYAQINAALDIALTIKDKQEALQQWENLRRRLDSWSALTSLHFSQDTTNEAYKQAQEYSDQLQPKLTALEVAMKQRLLNDQIAQN